MKRKPRLLSRILVPALLVLLLLPPLSCLIFSGAAHQYAYAKAGEELDALQQNVLPLLQSNFPGTDTPSPTASTEQVRTFLNQIGALMAKRGGDAKLILLSGEMRPIYPHEEQERAEVAALVADFVRALGAAELPETGEPAQFEASDGTAYLVSVYRVPTKSVQLGCIIAYCPTSQIGSWVHAAGMLVLGIAAVLVLVTGAVLWATVHRATKPLGRLCQAAERIGEGNFITIEEEFSLAEPEELRLSMNRMSEQLLHAEDVQKTFFQNVSHELRNPLMSISGYAQGIEQGVFAPPQAAAHTILTESARLTELVNSLLTLSRMEGDPQKPALTPLPLADPLEDCLDRLNGLAVKNGVRLELAPLDRSLTAWCEEKLLCTVLDNLLTNAIRYAKQAVSVSVVTKDNEVQISVADDGDGIGEKDLPHIFERCYKGKGGHFGLGLAIARTAAQKMEGSLTAANQETGGAVFRLSLKAQEQPGEKARR